MMHLSSVRNLHLTLGSALLAIIGCGSNGTGDVSGTAAELSAAEADINDTVESSDTAHEEAKACFEAYRSCEETNGDDAETCRDALKACLPEQAPVPARCGDGGAGRHRGGDGGVRDDGDDDSDEDVDESSDEDGSLMSDAGVDQDGGMSRDKRRGHRGRGRGHACGRPDVSHERMHACREVSASDLAQGSDASQTASSHAQCVQKAFSDRVSELCTRASELCTRSDADPTICARITEACTAVSSSQT